MKIGKPFNSSFWQDAYIRSLDRDTKDVYLFLITSHRLQLSPVYEITIGEISKHALCESTNKGAEAVEKAISRLVEDGKIMYEEDWVFLLNRMKHQSMNPSMAIGLLRELESSIGLVPASFIPHIDSIKTQYGQGADRVPTGSQQDADKLKPKPKLKPNGHSLSSPDGDGVSPNVKFDEFWKTYPKKKGKLAASKAWKKLSEEDKVGAKEALPKHKCLKQWKDKQFIPEPASWLNARRWEDKIDRKELDIPIYRGGDSYD